MRQNAHNSESTAVGTHWHKSVWAAPQPNEQHEDTKEETDFCTHVGFCYLFRSCLRDGVKNIVVMVMLDTE